jgi:6-phosphogluconolactonase (cycloisomerase 2 family)
MKGNALRDAAVISFEPVERRLMMSAGHGGDKHQPATVQDVVYVESNNFNPGKNSILAYHRTATGTLVPIGEFLTGGTGYYNADERLGPDDSDQEIIATPDHKTLYAVNSGSDTIAAFKILDDGSLKRIGVFNSGGDNPVSIGLAGDNLYVVNKSFLNAGQTTGGDNPNITGFQIKPDGSLKAIPHGTVEIAAGTVPTQALISPDHKHLFALNVFENPVTLPPGFPPFVPPFSSTIVSYNIRPNGRLEVADRLEAPNFPPFMLGLQNNPNAKVFYAGFLLSGSMGVFSYDDAGHITFDSQAPAGAGDAGMCWVEVSKDGQYAYATNAITDTVTVYSLHDPIHPQLIQSLALNGPKVPIAQPAAAVFSTTPFQLELDPTDDYLFVLNHETTVDDSFPDGNAIHVLKVNDDGTLTEIDSTLLTGIVPDGAHPKGVVAL